MAFRSTVLPPIRSSTVDRMHGVPATNNTSRLNDQTIFIPKMYNQKYECRQYDNLSFGRSRPLPPGRGPLDSNGKILTQYTEKQNTQSFVRNGPMDHSKTDFSSSSLKKSYRLNSSASSSLHGRRSAISSTKVSEREKTPFSAISYQQTHLLDKSTSSRNSNRDVAVYSKTPSRSSLGSSHYTDKQDRYDTDKRDRYDPDKRDRYDTDKRDEYDTDKRDRYDTDKRDEYDTDKRDRYDPDKRDEYDIDKRDENDPDKIESEITRKMSNLWITKDCSTESPSDYDSSYLARRNSENASPEKILTKSVSRHCSNSSISTKALQLYITCDVLQYGKYVCVFSNNQDFIDAKNVNSGKVGLRNLGNTDFIDAKNVNSGKVGLQNLGNTCFMNSILQCLSHTHPLLEYCLKEDYLLDKVTSNGMKGGLITAYANLMCSMWKDGSDAYVSPNAFKTKFQRFAPRFMGYSQQDAQEFLRYLLEGLHEDINKITQKPKSLTVNDEQFNRVNNIPNSTTQVIINSFSLKPISRPVLHIKLQLMILYRPISQVFCDFMDSMSKNSWRKLLIDCDFEQSREYWKNYLRFDNSRIVEVFVGQLKSVLKFRDCGHRSVTFDPFWDLSLPIPKGRSVVNLMNCIDYFMREESLDDKPTCTKCKERKSCTKGFSIQKFPKILVLHLKRFSQERYSRKISTYVEFPVTRLDMSKFAAEDVSQHAIYNLYAVSNHSGGTHSGHYTAYCKHPFLNDWNLFNDTRVSHVNSTQVTSSEGYVLFYELADQPSFL